MPLLDASDQQAVQRAAALLADGQLVAFATETVYGLGARADDDAAVGQIFAAKGRPSAHPLIVHVADALAAEHFAEALPPLARRLMDAFWPGPLTVIVPRRPDVATAAAGGHATIGLRCPAHPAALALLRAAAALGVAGVAAPSANRFGRISPTQAAHVVAEFGADLTVLDGGDCAIGIESTIVDCSRGRPVLLRPGQTARADIERAAGEPLGSADALAPNAPGTLAAHYAPRAPLRLMPTAALRAAVDLLPQQRDAQGAGRLAVYFRSVKPPAWIDGRRMPADPAAAAHELFAVLRRFDDAGAALIWVEAPPDDAAWDGVRDRLQRAAA